MCISRGSRETEPRLDRHNKRASNKIYFKELAHMAMRPISLTFLGEPGAGWKLRQEFYVTELRQNSFPRKSQVFCSLTDCRKSIYIMEDSYLKSADCRR